MENNKQIVEVIESNGIVLTEAQSIVTCFGMHLSEATKLVEEAKTIAVTDENDKEGMDRARNVRLALARVRCASEADRKDFKSDYLKKGKAIDSIAKMVSSLTEPLEEKLEAAEKYALNLAIEKKKADEKARFEERVQRLQPYMLPTMSIENIFGIKDMPDNSFEKLVENSKVVFETHQAKTAKEEQEKAEFERLQKEEQERIRTENEKLKAEALAKENADKFERESREQKERIEREEREAKEAKEKALHEAELAEQKRVANEATRIEREAKEKAEAELKAREEAERAEKERIESERKAKEEADRQAKLAPDREKLVAFADRIRNVELPADLADEDYQTIVLNVGGQLVEIANQIKLATVEK